MKIASWLVLGCLSSTAYGLQVAPSYQIFEAKPGEMVEGECQILNNEEGTLTIKAFSKDWFTAPANTGIVAADWLLVDVPEFQLAKGESRTIPFAIKVPEKAVGELVGMVSVEFSTDVETMLKQMVSVAVYATIPGTEVLKGELKAIMMVPSSTSLQVGIQIQNQGNVHLRPTGEFWIHDMKKKPMMRLTIQQGRPTYPGRDGNYFGQVSGVTLKPGTYKALVTLQDVDRHKQFLQVEKTFTLSKDNKVSISK